MPGDLTVKKPAYGLKVGSNENYISFEITATQALNKLKADISIPCGRTPDKVYLCADGVRANLTPASDPAGKLKFLKQPAKATLVSWRSSDFALKAGETVTIKITGFNPERDGEARLQLKIGNSGTSYDESHTVAIAPTVGATIIGFDVNATSVLQRSEVTITCITAGAKTVKLYADKIEVKKPDSSHTEAGVTVNKYTHAPEADTTYRLEAADALAGKLAERQIVVSVTSRLTWYSWDLLGNSLAYKSAGLHYYPTLLLDAKDLSGETDGDKLYGIFLCKETGEAGLWSSSSGVDDWSFLGNVPDGMAESPGVIHNQALWLIGGSSVDPLGNVSKRVCWYYKNENQEMVWREWDENGSERKALRTPAPRKCHACAVFNGKVWVLGGLSQQNQALDDVWTCSADPVGGNFNAAWEPSKALPTPRCLAVVTATPASKHTGPPRLWVCGGATHPYNLNETFYDLWSTRDGKAWEPLDLPKKAAVGKIEILAAALFYDAGDQLLHLAGVFRIPGEGFKTSDHELKDANLEDSWADGSLTGFGWQYTTDLFLIRSVSFKERWIFSPIYQDQTGAKGANARIYIT